MAKLNPTWQKAEDKSAKLYNLELVDEGKLFLYVRDVLQAAFSTQTMDHYLRPLYPQPHASSIHIGNAGNSTITFEYILLIWNEI